MDKPTSTFYSFGPFRIDAQKRMLLRGEEPVSLAPKAFDLLLALIESRGRVLVKDDLMQKVWPDQIVEDANITVNMSALRKALGENPHEHLYIVTIPGRGYRFVADVTESKNGDGILSASIAGLDNHQPKAAVNGAADTSKRIRPGAISLLLQRASGWKAIAVGIFVVGVALASYFYFNRPNRALALTERDTILLADFDNKTGDEVFDGTLKQGLAVQLEQSPFLNIFPDTRIRETLRYMSRSPDERVTKDIAREICEREGIKAMLTGSIATLGSHYVISVEATNAHTGDVIARQQIEAESKEQVLKKLGEAATRMREKLGESLASIQKFDALLEQVTTSSLEALKAYSLAREMVLKGKSAEAIPLCKRAIELDPNFARAYSQMAVAGSSGAIKEEEVIEAAKKAFELRERTSEYEKLKITSTYYALATGEIEKSIEALQSLTLMYPRDYVVLDNLAGLHVAIGEYEKAVEEFQQIIRLNSNAPIYYGGLALALRCLNRFDEAKQVIEQALPKYPDFFHIHLYRIAVAQDDTTAMQRELDWLKGKNSEEAMLGLQGGVAWYLGQARTGRDLWNRVADIRISRNRKELAADQIASNAWRAAIFGDCRKGREDIARASSFPTNFHSLLRFGMTYALCGDVGRAESLADEYARRYPKDTLVNAVELPTLRAAIEMRRNNPALVIQILQSATRFERAGAGYSTPYWPAYLRGQAYLALRQGADAATEFQKILDRRGLTPHEVFFPLAYLGLARAALLMGDPARARRAYEDFFGLWKDADPDIPILLEARREYQKLK